MSLTLPKEDSFQMELEEENFPNPNSELAADDSAMSSILAGGSQ